MDVTDADAVSLLDSLSRTTSPAASAAVRASLVLVGGARILRSSRLMLATVPLAEPQTIDCSARLRSFIHIKRFAMQQSAAVLF